MNIWNGAMVNTEKGKAYTYLTQFFVLPYRPSQKLDGNLRIVMYSIS
jgi:hypothetical protein